LIISTKGRYGVRAMFVLAKRYEQDEPTSIKYIATEQSISEQYLEQLFSKLKHADLIKSVRGQKGGYSLTKEPNNISIGDIIIALEGPLAPSECVIEDNDSCENIECCTTRSMWKKIYDGFNTVVNSLSLGDMLEEYRENIKENKQDGRC
jgi:Rrf2 family transcriptional regulator, cysteine metabolism repressor